VLGDPNSMAFALDATHERINKYTGPRDHNYELIVDIFQGLVDLAFPQRLAQAIVIGDEQQVTGIILHHSEAIATDERMSSVLATSISKRSMKTLKLLIANHININVPLNAQRDTALILAVRASQRHQRPPLIGPLLKRRTSYGDRLKVFSHDMDDFGSMSAFYGRIADLYGFAGRERTFLRLPSCQDLIYELGPRHIINRATSKETEAGEKNFRWIHLPANNVCHLFISTLKCKTNSQFS
jgi:ankyrin repeat protein